MSPRRRTPAKRPAKHPAKRPMKPGKPVKPIKPISPIEFDPDSYPIWISPSNFVNTAHYNFEAPGFLRITKDRIMALKPGTTQASIEVALSLSSKLKLHGIGILYKMSDPQSHISYISINEWKEDDFPTKLWYERVTLNKTTRTEFRVKIDDHQVSLPLSLTINAKLGEHQEVQFYGVRVMVKDA